MSPCRSDYIFTDEQVGVWHVVSEDSDHFTAWLAVVHRLHDLDNFEQPTWCEVRASLDHSHTPYELLEVQMLRGSQRVLLKERNYLLKKIAPSADNKLRHLETSLVTPPICSMGLSPEVDRKASFSVNKTSNPADQSFLLIVRIRRFVTARLTNTVRC